MATFAYQKEELLKYYEKTDQIVNKHQKSQAIHLT